MLLLSVIGIQQERLKRSTFASEKETYKHLVMKSFYLNLVRNLYLLLPIVSVVALTACLEDNLPDDDSTDALFYTLNVTASEGGTATVELAEYRAGEDVVVTTVPGDGYYFNEWLENGTSVSADPVYRFQMSEHNVTLHATFAEIPHESSNNYRVAVGANYTLLLDENGNLSAFGFNESGQLGDGTTENRLTPVSILPQTQFTHVFCAGSSSYAIDREGNLYAWGNNENGRLGDGSTTDRYVPTQIMSGTRFTLVSPGGERTFTDISAKGTHSLAVDSDGIVVCYPLWYSRMATPMQSFLHAHASQLSGKTLALICTSASSGISQTVADARRLCPNSIIPEALWIRASAIGNAHEEIAQWLTEIGINK